MTARGALFISPRHHGISRCPYGLTTKTTNYNEIMTSKDVVWAVLRGMECKPITKSKLQQTLQTMLETENELEDGDNDGKWDNSFYFTNGEADSTHNFCDIRIDYLPTRNEGEIYVTGTEILDYQN